MELYELIKKYNLLDENFDKQHIKNMSEFVDDIIKVAKYEDEFRRMGLCHDICRLIKGMVGYLYLGDYQDIDEIYLMANLVDKISISLNSNNDIWSSLTDIDYENIISKVRLEKGSWHEEYLQKVINIAQIKNIDSLIAFINNRAIYEYLYRYAVNEEIKIITKGWWRYESNRSRISTSD